jgi:hypothetical protein
MLCFAEWAAYFDLDGHCEVKLSQVMPQCPKLFFNLSCCCALECYVGEIGQLILLFFNVMKLCSKMFKIRSILMPETQLQLKHRQQL